MSLFMKKVSLNDHLNKEYALNSKIATLEVLAQELKGAYGSIDATRVLEIGRELTSTLHEIDVIRFHSGK